VVGLGRVELPARSLGNCCSIHLSYSPADTMQIILYELSGPREVSAAPRDDEVRAEAFTNEDSSFCVTVKTRLPSWAAYRKQGTYRMVSKMLTHEFTSGNKGELMKTVRLLAPIAFLFVLVSPAHSQEYEYPQWEIFGGVDYLHVDTGGGTLLNGQTFLLPNSYGWHITATENKASWIGGIIDVSGDYANTTVNLGSTEVPFNVRFNGQIYPFLFGPRFYYRKLSRITIFGQPTIGFAVARLSVASGSALLAGSGLSSITQTKWAYAFGGGADYDLNDRFAIRAQADWIRSHFPETFLRDFQNDYRVSGGIVFKIR
jgi:opacity protein-like surface antigen